MAERKKNQERDLLNGENTVGSEIVDAEIKSDGVAKARSSGGRKEKKTSRPRRQLEGKLAKAEEKAGSLRDSLMRLQAEFENFKKRQVREREEQRRNTCERIIGKFLPVLDNLERAVGHGSKGVEPEKLVEGIQLVIKQLRESFKQSGVEQIPALGETFDPHVHEAMSRVETDGDPPDGTVVEVYQVGYLINGRVLRPAMVGVAKIVDETDSQEPS